MENSRNQHELVAANDPQMTQRVGAITAPPDDTESPLLEINQPAPTGAAAPLGPTGIPAVDAALAPHWGPGKLVLASGCSGAGKTVLCGQIACNAVRQGLLVDHYSTEALEQEVWERLWACGISWDYAPQVDQLNSVQHSAGKTIPSDGPNSEALSGAANDLYQLLVRHYSFEDVPEFKQDPIGTLKDILRGIEPPDVLLLDHLQVDLPPFHPQIENSRDGSRYLRQITCKFMEILREYAQTQGVRVLVTCPQHPRQLMHVTKRVRPEGLSDFSVAFEHCDAFVGISQLRSMADENEVRNNASRQYLHIVPRRGHTQLIPVLAEFQYQRFSPFDDHDGPQGKLALSERAARMVMTSEYRGFRFFRRKVFEKLLNLGNPNCINVYALALLLADYGSRHRRGTFSASYTKMGELLGLSGKQVSSACGGLIEARLLRKTDRKRGRDHEFKVVNFGGSRDGSTRGYVLLASNLLDAARQHLIGNPVLFRTWLHLLHAARHAPDGESLERGQLNGNGGELALRQGDPEAMVLEAVDLLIDEGRVSELHTDLSKALQIDNYDLYQNREHYSLKMAGKNSA